MKKLTVTLFILLSLAVSIIAQIPEAIKYQAVYRDATGQVQANKPVDVVFLIHSDSPTGEVVFEETHSVETNAYGLFAINLGEGTGSNSLGEVSWGTGEYFLEVKIDGTSMGTSQMLSVPYALFAGDAAKLGGASATEWDEAIMQLQQEMAALKNEINSVKDSVALKSPDGTIWNVWIDDEGNLQTKKGDYVITYTTYNSYPGVPINSVNALASDSITLPCSQNYETYATANGYYTDFSKGNCRYKANMQPVEENLFCGVVFNHTQGDPTIVASNTNIKIYNVNNEQIASLTTDDKGRFAIDLIPGTYNFVYPVSFYYLESEVITMEVNKYADLHFIISDHGGIVVFKPNLYIYPEEEQNTKVTLEFPQSGEVIKSDPEYGTGWNVNIAPNGVIDGENTFLFYESIQPDKWQYTSGWMIAREELTNFFTTNMTALKFNEQEIKDFIDYWIPLLKDKPYYAITPQFNKEIDPLIVLTITPQPKNTNRLFYCIQGMDNNNYKGLKTPQMPDFSRNGYTAVEWGVIIK